MKLLLDTHLLLWSMSFSSRLSSSARTLLTDAEHQLYFSAVSIWEIGIKRALNKPDFTFEADVVRSALLSHGYEEIALTGGQALSLQGLPMIHRDPFDRILIAQAINQGLTLVTADRLISGYPAHILLV